MHESNDRAIFMIQIKEEEKNQGGEEMRLLKMKLLSFTLSLKLSSDTCTTL